MKELFEASTFVKRIIKSSSEDYTYFLVAKSYYNENNVPVFEGLIVDSKFYENNKELDKLPKNSINYCRDFKIVEDFDKKLHQEFINNYTDLSKRVLEKIERILEKRGVKV